MSYRGETRTGNRASDRSQIAAKPFSISGPDVLTVEILGITERKHRHGFMPGLNEDVSRWNVEVAVEAGFSIRGLSMGRVAHIGVFVARKSNRVDVISSEMGDTIYLPVTYETVHRGITTRQGFQPSVGPHAAVPPTGAVHPVEVADPPDETQGADDV